VPQSSAFPSLGTPRPVLLANMGTGLPIVQQEIRSDAEIPAIPCFAGYPFEARKAVTVTCLQKQK